MLLVSRSNTRGIHNILVESEKKKNSDIQRDAVVNLCSWVQRGRSEKEVHKRMTKMTVAVLRQ